MKGSIAAVQEHRTPGATGRILLVDDEEDILHLVTEMLGFLLPGWTVERANNGDQALQAVARAPPTIVVSDFRMPAMDGLEMAAKIRALGHRFPIIVMTAFVDSSLEEKITEDGLVQVLIRKPLDIDQLVATILCLSG